MSQPAQHPDLPQLPIRRVAFYKHGVAMVEREGRVQGEILSLVFRAGDMDDALKSLTVIDRAGGQVVCADYELPASAIREQDALALDPGTGMLDLIERLVGWRVRVELAGRSAPLEGRVTGLQYAKERRRLKGATLMLLDETTGAVQAAPAAELARIVPLEGRVGDDLARFLDAGKRAGGTQTVSLRLTPGEHDLAVSCLVPAPSWRVSYRVIAESDEGADTGRLLLQGWGLVDNRFDEDLENVRLTLVAGQPISFVYDLTTSRAPARKRVQDESRMAAGPVGYASGLVAHAAAHSAAMAGAASFDMASAEFDDERGAMLAADIDGDVDDPRLGPEAAFTGRPLRSARIADLEAAEPASTSADQRETFAYEVLRPVSIPRGASALVPVLQAKLAYRRELLFNEAKHPGHPVAALRCENRSGLVLERGPATLVEDGRYRGEAIVPFTGRDGSLYLPYAVELGISVRVESDRSVEDQRLRLAGSLLHREIAWGRSHRYEIVNRTADAQTLTIERAIDTLPGELFETPAPVARGDGVYRWKVDCPAGATVSFTVRSRRLAVLEQQLVDLGLDELARFLADAGLTPDTRRALESLRAELALIEENRRRIAQLAEQRKQLLARQEHLRRNIGALAAGGDEGEVRLKMVRELQAAEGTLSGIDRLVAELEAENERRRGDLGTLLPGGQAQRAA